jgi:hypothetical protein
MATLLSLQQTMQGYALRIKDRSDAIVRGGAGVFLESVANDTPYDEGDAISNWLVGSGAPRTAVVGPRSFKGGKASNVAATVSAGKARIQSYRYGTNIYITNNLPYIELLNSGSSSQHPGAFVEAGVQRSLSFIQKQKLLNGN